MPGFSPALIAALFWESKIDPRSQPAEEQDSELFLESDLENNEEQKRDLQFREYYCLQTIHQVLKPIPTQHPIRLDSLSDIWAAESWAEGLVRGFFACLVSCVSSRVEE